MLELAALFLLIMVPAGAILYAVQEQQAQLAHRQFLSRRIGNQLSMVERVKKRSTAVLNSSIEQLLDRLSKGAFFQSLVQDIEFTETSPNGKNYIFWRLFIPAVSGVALLVIGLIHIGFLGLMVAGFYYVKVMLAKKSKLDKSLKQLPDLIAMISNSLRAGNSLFACFSFASEEMPAPTKHYFYQLYTELQYGIPFKQASYKMLQPLISIPEYCMFVSAVNIQRESGGNLSEVLEILSTTIRERLKMKAKISALTGQSRLTGYVIGAAPTLMLVGLSILNYKFVAPLYEHPTGKLMLGIAIVMQIIGFIVIKKIVDIRV
jgi:tight adherence protein B